MSSNLHIPRHGQYKGLIYKDAEAPPTLDEITAIEREVGRPLPGEFIDFMSFTNGATSDFVIDLPPPYSQSEGLERIYSMHRENTSARRHVFLLDELRIDRKRFRIPPETLLFGGHDRAVRFYLDLRQEAPQYVVAYVEGAPSWTGLAADTGFVVVGSSITDFIEKLHAPDYLVPRLLSNLRKAEIDENDVAIASIGQYLDLLAPGWQCTT